LVQYESFVDLYIDHLIILLIKIIYEKDIRINEHEVSNIKYKFILKFLYSNINLIINLYKENDSWRKIRYIVERYYMKIVYFDKVRTIGKWRKTMAFFLYCNIIFASMSKLSRRNKDRVTSFSIGLESYIIFINAWSNIYTYTQLMCLHFYFVIQIRPGK